MEIKVIHDPPKDKLEGMGVFDWPVWTGEVGGFPWTEGAGEAGYWLEGRVAVTSEGGAPVEVGAGDLVTFPRGMRCTWKVTRPVRKHYTFA